MNSKCIYYVEGNCEQQLINALKEKPSRLIPGKVKVHNVINNLIPKSQMIAVQPGTKFVLVFDTDVNKTDILQKNVELLNRYCRKLQIVYLPQVLNFEDELVRCTDVKSAEELTQSKGLHNFKSDFCKLRTSDCRTMLERHNLKTDKLWTEEVPSDFVFIERNNGQVKLS